MNNPIGILSKTLSFLFIAAVMFRCSDEQFLDPEESFEDATLSIANTSPSSCSTCSYVVPSNTNTQIVDAKKLGLKPGAVICLSAANKYGNIVFRNVVGTASAPMIITNCGGTAVLNAGTRPFGLKTETSKHFRITGGSGSTYGIKINGGHMGMTLEKLSTNFEVNNVEVYNTGFAGIMAKTEPSCDDATIRGNFVMRDVSLHNNYVHDTKGEGFYVGHSFYTKGLTLSCGVRLPHLIEGVEIYENKITNPGWEAIQVGCALKGAYVYNNTITNYGAKNVAQQNNGIQFSEGSKAICYGNYLNGGKGHGINVVGHGDAFIHNNVIKNAGMHGMFLDERLSVGLGGFRIINNTIINPKGDGIRNYGDKVTNVVVNNIIVNPGSYSTYTYPRTGNDAYVYKLSKTMKVTMANNIFTRDINSVKFANHSSSNYRITSGSPARNKGKDVKSYGMIKDFYKQTRLKGSAYDIGASEY